MILRLDWLLVSSIRIAKWMAGEAVPGGYAKAWTDIVLKTKGDFIRNQLRGLRNDLNNQETGFLFIT